MPRIMENYKRYWPYVKQMSPKDYGEYLAKRKGKRKRKRKRK